MYKRQTVTATRPVSASAQVVGFIVIEFQSAACNQAVQSVSTTWTSGTTTTQAITSVNTSNAILIYAGSNAAVTSNQGQAEQYVDLTNATTVTVHANTSSANSKTFNFFVVEFALGVLHSAVQRGVTTLTAVTSNTSTISSVNTSKAMLNFLHYLASQATNNIANCATNATLTNSTTVTAARSGNTNNASLSWEVAEFN